MSLLIKALDKAMTDKAITDKTVAQNKQAASQSLELSLESITPTTQSQPEVALTVPEATIEMSLEDEAGLGLAPNQYAKAKTVANVKSAKNAQADKASAAQTVVQQSQMASMSNETKVSKPIFSEPAQNPADKATLKNTLPPVFQAMASQSANNNQKVAAKVFVANQQSKTANSKIALGLLGLVGALAIWLAIQGYAYVKALVVPDVVVVKPTTRLIPHDVSEMNLQAPIANAEQTSNMQPEAVETEALNTVTIATETPLSTAPSNNFKQAEPEKLVAANAAAITESDDAMAVAEVAVKNNSQNKRLSKSQENSQKAYKNSAPIQITSKTPANSIDPNLSAAYGAFNRGEDALAQQKYRQVLQGDVRNTDALLGMAVIAQRQGRSADALGWYQKVLEIEPRNSIAQSAMLSAQINTDSIGRESRLKSMIAQQPEAHLYAELGNEYAEQNQWPSAQDAYFNASNLSPNNADYAFNLAISLEQLGKSNLALIQYRRALELLNKSGAGSPNRAILEARIQALQ